MRGPLTQSCRAGRGGGSAGRRGGSAGPRTGPPDTSRYAGGEYDVEATAHAPARIHSPDILTSYFYCGTHSSTGVLLTTGTYTQCRCKVMATRQCCTSMSVSTISTTFLVSPGTFLSFSPGPKHFLPNCNASPHASDFIVQKSRPSVSVSSWQFTLFHRVIAGESLPRLASGRVVAARESPALIWTPHSRAFCREEGSLHHFTAGTRTPADTAVNEASQSFTVPGERPTPFWERLEFLSNVFSGNRENSRTFVDSYTAARAGQASCSSAAESFR